MTFFEVWEHVQHRSAMTVHRAERLWWYARQVREVPGDIAEIGVYSGASAYLLARAFENTGKTIHGFDTFTGFPEIGPRETGYVGEMSCSLENVGQFLAGLGVILHAGRIEEQDPPPGALAFVHVDCDLESCYRSVLPRFWPKISRGGLLVMDDYGFGRWPGATTAAHEFFDGTDYRIEGLRGDNWSPEIARGADWGFVQGIVRKR